MREEPALTRDRILSYSLTAPVIDNVRAGPAVTGAATATGARAAAAPGAAGTGAAAAIGAATGAAATGAAVAAGRGAAAAGSGAGTISPGGGGRLVGAVVDCCWGAVDRNSAALSVALCEFVWLKKNQLTRSDASVRRSFNSEMPQLMRKFLN